jgi:hypothetical protein
VTAKREPGPGFSLSRWSRRKLQVARDAAATASAPAVPSAPLVAATNAPAAPAAVELPPVESLTFDSDFTAFLRPEVDDVVKRAALKQLFRDPRFNVMDGLDIYIDDYTKADPIPSDVLADLLQRFGGAPETAPVPAAAARAGEPAHTPPQSALSASGEEGAHAQRDAGDATVPPPANSGEGLPTERSAGESDVSAAEAGGDGAAAERGADQALTPSARSESR